MAVKTAVTSADLDAGLQSFGLDNKVVRTREEVRFPSIEELRDVFVRYHQGEGARVKFTVVTHMLRLKVGAAVDGVAPVSAEWVQSTRDYSVKPVQLEPGPGHNGSFTFIGTESREYGSGCEVPYSEKTEHTVRYQGGTLTHKSRRM